MYFFIWLLLQDFKNLFSAGEQRVSLRTLEVRFIYTMDTQKHITFKLTGLVFTSTLLISNHLKDSIDVKLGLQMWEKIDMQTHMRLQKIWKDL